MERPWETYRDCLRWEFGFTCSVCLVHETDVSVDGVRGSKQMTVEHRELRKNNPARAADYDNLIYVCTYCNQSRRDKPLVEGSVELLNPAEASWSEHFRLGDEYRLVPKEGDLAAERTACVYDVDEPRRQEIRRSRDERLRWSLDRIEEIPQFLEWVSGQLRESRIQPIELVRLARELRRDLRHAERELERYPAFPKDRSKRCACPKRKTFSLPPGLQRQLTRPGSKAVPR